jgi:uncharacterized protein GlcG (DUF336 family)
VTEDQALAAVQTAVAAARGMGLRVTAAAVDAGGHVKALLRMDGAPFQSAAIAADKAKTSAGFAAPTQQWQERIGARPHLLVGLNGRDGFIPIGGGLPVFMDDVLVGAIGISGATEAQDCDIAAAAIAAIAAIAPPPRGD